jgi:hypothetical protein
MIYSLFVDNTRDIASHRNQLALGSFSLLTVRLGTQSNFQIMSTPCGLSQEKVLNWRENGLCPVAGGLCRNLKMGDGKLVECGWPDGEHPSETAGGNNFSNLPVSILTVYDVTVTSSLLATLSAVAAPRGDSGSRRTSTFIFTLHIINSY